jgi:hypothetical protein
MTPRPVMTMGRSSDSRLLMGPWSGPSKRQTARAQCGMTASSPKCYLIGRSAGRTTRNRGRKAVAPESFGQSAGAQANDGTLVKPRHYLWAGLDFLIDAEGRPTLVEANKSSHMLGEYLRFFADERPFELIAARMNARPGTPCLLWRKGDPFPDADEDACFIARHLTPFLEQPPVVCNVEDNQRERPDLTTRDGRTVQPGSLFRWWYGLPWSYERAGTLVINPNCLWVAVRDKLRCTESLRAARSFRAPRSFGVESPEEATLLLEEHREVFADGYVVKPRVGWGGYGVQIAEPGERPRLFAGAYLLSERIRPQPWQGRFWDVRAFVMDGQYVGALRHASASPNTNFYQGGEPSRLDDATTALIEPAALEAVQLLDAAAEQIHRGPIPQTALTHVEY